MPEKSITEHLDRITVALDEACLARNCAHKSDCQCGACILELGARESLTALRASISEMERKQKAAEIVLCGYFEHREAHDLEIVGAESAKAVIAGLREQIAEMERRNTALAEAQAEESEVTVRLCEQIAALIIERDQALSAQKSTQDWYGSRWQRMHDWFRSPAMKDTQAANDWFSIVANGGLLGKDEPPVCFMAQVNMTRFALKQAEKRSAALEVERDQARAEVGGYKLYLKSVDAGIEQQVGRIVALEEALREIISQFKGVQCQEPICDSLIGATLEIARVALFDSGGQTLTDSQNLTVPLNCDHQCRDAAARIVALKEAIRGVVENAEGPDSAFENPEVPRKYLVAARAALSSTTTPQTGSPSIPTPSVESEANRESEPSERDRLVGLFRDPIFVEAIPNGYCGPSCFPDRPWFIVTTRAGRIKIGWRKRVIAIDWSDSTITATAEELFPCENVTKDGRLIHAWGYDKAREYVASLPICDTPTERVTLAGLPVNGLSADQSIAKQEFE